MSVIVSDWVWRHSETTGSLRLLLLALADNADDRGLAWPGLDYLARKTCLSRRYVITLVHRLEDLGCIRVERKKEGKHHLSNRYQINMDDSLERPDSSMYPSSLPGDQEITTGSDSQITGVVIPNSPELSINRHFNHQLTTEDAILENPGNSEPAAANLTQIAYSAFTEITGMIDIPGDFKIKDRALGLLKDLSMRYNDTLVDFLTPFFLAQCNARNLTTKRTYAKSGLFWLTDWAVSGEIPDYVLKQLPDTVLEQMGLPWIEAAANARKTSGKEKEHEMTPQEILAELERCNP